MTQNINGLIQINTGVVNILVQRTAEFEQKKNYNLFVDFGLH